jgi:hypothetical protein
MLQQKVIPGENMMECGVSIFVDVIVEEHNIIFPE